MKIHDLLSDPDKLASLTDEELRKALAPFIPAVRKAVLPEEKPQKLGIAMRMAAEILKNPMIAAEIGKARQARKE